MIRRYFATSASVNALNLSYTLSLGHPLSNVNHKDAIEKYKQGDLKDYVSDKFNQSIRRTGAVVGEKQLRTEMNYWQKTIQLYVQDTLLTEYARSNNIKFSPNPFVKREQRSNILDELARWRVKQKTPEQQARIDDDKRNMEIIENTKGFTYVVSNTVMKQQIHRILLQALHQAQVRSEHVSRGWSLRTAHKRFPKDLLLDPYTYFKSLGYTLHNYPEWSVNINVDKVANFSERAMRKMLAELIMHPPKLDWDKHWKYDKKSTHLPEMEEVLHDKPHKIAWRLRTPYTDPLRQALARRAKVHGFHFGDPELHKRKPDPVLQQYKQKQYSGL
ncbi:hypothetical protein E3P77_01663 [Wallemia ichthyophaga]|nr:hypothetical protein E3P77_01663 [Wallemia ichthyophaga]